MLLKKLVNDKELWDAFTAELDATISGHHKSMETQDDSVSIHRTQGSIFALQRLKYLREKINGHSSM